MLNQTGDSECVITDSSVSNYGVGVIVVELALGHSHCKMRRSTVGVIILWELFSNKHETLNIISY